MHARQTFTDDIVQLVQLVNLCKAGRAGQGQVRLVLRIEVSEDSENPRG